MRNLLAMVGAAVVTVVGVGYYLDWFKVHKAPSGDGKQSYSVDVNTKKIGEDIAKGKTKVQKVIESKTKQADPAAPLTPPGPSFPDAPEGSFVPTAVPMDKVPEPPSGVSPELLLPPIDSKTPQDR